MYMYHTTSSASLVPRAVSLTPSSLALTPGHPGYTTPGNNQICLAQYQQRCLTMSQDVHQMPTIKNLSVYHNALYQSLATPDAQFDMVTH